MAAVLGTWSNLRAQRYAAYGDKVKWADHGLETPATLITVTLQLPAGNGKTSKPIRHTLGLGKAVAGSAGDRYARLDQGPGLVVLSAAQVGEFTHPYLDFVNKAALNLDSSKIVSLHRRMGEAELEVINQTAMRRAGGGPEPVSIAREEDWQIVKPAKHQADGPTLSSLSADLAGLRAKRVAAYPVKELAPYGLDKPAAVVTIRTAGANGKNGEHLIKLGKTVGGEHFALVDNSTAVIVLPAGLAERLTAAPLKFRDRFVARTHDVDRISLEREPRKAVFAKVEGTWKLTQPLEAGAEQADLEDLLDGVRRLRADELVADHPSDLKPFGLDRPEVRWQFWTSDKAGLTLLVGDREKLKGPGKETVGPRCYAKLPENGLVFLLDPKMSTRVLGEYRSRSPWTIAVDAAQVEGLSYGYAANPFALEKVDNEWHIAGRPGIKVNPDAVRETLDALAGLKVERFVIDKGADLKLYGLEPPQLALAIRTRSGSRTLYIGRHEGASKRYYARVDEAGNTAVFTLSEADGGKIVRLVPAFTARFDQGLCSNHRNKRTCCSKVALCLQQSGAVK
jgi:hypothetical protein